jgi:hypothetical protein
MGGIPESRELQNEELRWARAAAWARGQSCGPWGQHLIEPGQPWPQTVKP